MQTAPLRRIALVLALGAALLVPTGALAAPAAHQPPPTGPSFLQSLWGWFAALWDDAGAEIDPYGNRAGDRLVPLWGEAGMEIDPFGNRSSTPAPPPPVDQQDAGVLIDPFGAH